MWNDGGAIHIWVKGGKGKTFLWSPQGFRLRVLAQNSYFSQNFWEKPGLVFEMKVSHAPSPCQTVAKRERKQESKTGKEKQGDGEDEERDTNTSVKT